MANKNTKDLNKRSIKLQENMNKGWKIGPITIILVILLFIMFIASFGFGWWG